MDHQVSHVDDGDMDGDTLHEECGVFGILGHSDAAALTALGLHALQHRGQEAAGIVSFDGTQFRAEKRMGLVGDHYHRPGNTRQAARQHGHRPYALFDNRRSRRSATFSRCLPNWKSAASPLPITAISPMA